ncbi:MAG: NADH-quinone oxidoreductase subunit H [Actinobacteria bacterium]|nr:NADH-quinone oxidoreductase subunit H [Actinomycetota bacterium]
MAFVGKLAYLALFPGLLFIYMAGLAARGLLGGMSGVVTGGSPRGPALGLPGVLRLLTAECIPTGGSLSAVIWLAPPVMLFALSWVSCMLFGVVGGDLALLFSLLLLSSAAVILICFSSENPRVRQNGRSEAAALLGWAIPLALVIAGASLRTGEASVAGLIDWQVRNGGLLWSMEGGGALAVAGTAMMLAAALLCALLLMRLRPLGRGMFSEAPAGIAQDITGPPLALLRIAETASLAVAPLLLTALFLAGPASNWYEVAFWVLKILGLLLLLGIVDLVSARARSDRLLPWSLGVGGGLALAGLVLVWLGVS